MINRYLRNSKQLVIRFQFWAKEFVDNLVERYGIIQLQRSNCVFKLAFYFRVAFLNISQTFLIIEDALS